MTQDRVMHTNLYSLNLSLLLVILKKSINNLLPLIEQNLEEK